MWMPGKTLSLCLMHFNGEDFTRLMNSGLNLKHELKQDDIGVCLSFKTC